MRISEDRYSRDLRRIQLACRMMQHEVRTQWICAWTGLSGARVRNLYRSYEESLDGAQRHRGPSPKRISSFLRSPQLRTEASAAGGLAQALGVIPDQPMANARRVLPTLESGERLCQAYELFRQIAPEARLTMDQLILLVIALAERQDLEIAHCRNCHGALLVDRLGASRRLCTACRQATGHTGPAAAAQIAIPDEDALAEATHESAVALQQPLF
jgi:hypothetical protein